VRNAFQPPNYQQFLRQQLRRLRQTSSVREYTTQFQNIVGQIEGMKPLDQVMMYVEGLKSAIQQEVSYQAPQTLAAAIELAIRYDTAIWGIGRITSRVSSSKPSRPTNNNFHRLLPFHNNNGPTPMELDPIRSVHT